MESFPDISPLWDLSQASSFSQLPDDDFLALLQKQFPTDSDHQPNFHVEGFNTAINPQSLTRYPLPTLTPPSEDSSPSPPNMNGNETRERSQSTNDDDPLDPALKRKASDDDLDDEPSQKNQHTTNDKKGSGRRKSTGGPDENRLLKRKEQNRAAQRAFRERKEKHVKDLEDKVAALEAKNEQALSENENLRDLLSRLQHENLSLKQSSFTFSVPKTAASSSSEQGSSSFTPSSGEGHSPLNLFSSGTPSTSATSPTASSSALPKPNPFTSNPLDWTSLTSFDPSILSILDEGSQPTATDGAMNMDFGFGNGGDGLYSNTPYTTIASNPAFMSYASAFDSVSPSASTPHDNNTFGFDMSSLSQWSPPSSSSAHESGLGSLDDLFGGGYVHNSSASMDLGILMANSPAAISPISHHNTRSPSVTSNAVASSSSSTSTSNSMFSTPRDSSSSASNSPSDRPSDSATCAAGGPCPKTKLQLAKAISEEGTSPFAPATSASVRKCADATFGPMVMCEGSTFPKTEKSDKNVEVLSAWRSITSNPRFKDADINELCTEFTNKARCDGTKVVLEPQGVHHILETLSSKKQQ